jgi:uncharacterized membrane protein YcaP (DUF421 family)
MACMWNHIFDLHLSLGEKVVRAVIIYAFLVIALRLVGKRELSQLNTLDFVVLLAVANAVQNGLIGDDNSITGAVVGATVLFIVDAVLAWVLFRQTRLQRLVEGTPTLLMDEGRVLEDALRREEMTREDLLVEIQSAGAATLDDVRTASLLPSGKVIVVPKEPSQSTLQYDDLRARIDHLTELVESLRPASGTTGG